MKFLLIFLFLISYAFSQESEWKFTFGIYNMDEKGDFTQTPLNSIDFNYSIEYFAKECFAGKYEKSLDNILEIIWLRNGKPSGSMCYINEKGAATPNTCEGFNIRCKKIGDKFCITKRSCGIQTIYKCSGDKLEIDDKKSEEQEEIEDTKQEEIVIKKQKEKKNPTSIEQKFLVKVNYEYVGSSCDKNHSIYRQWYIEANSSEEAIHVAMESKKYVTSYACGHETKEFKAISAVILE